MSLTYYPVQQRWRRLRPIYESWMARSIWLPEMFAYQATRMEDYGVSYAYPEVTPALRPADWESMDWRYGSGRRGPEPGYWQYVCAGACHWLCSVNLFVAERAEPKRPWRIVTSDKHSTVWDGDQTLWDLNFLALGIAPELCWKDAAEHHTAVHLEPGEMTIHQPPAEWEQYIA
jgi:hypothetical protein